MKKQIFIIFTLFLFVEINWSQELLPVEYDTTNTNAQIIVNGNGFHLSSAIENSFSRKFLFGGNITEEIKQNSFDNHNLYERIGGGYRLNAQYRSNKELFKNYPDLSWMVNISNETHFTSEYAQGLFGLMFFGNEKYAGQEANLTNSIGNFVEYFTIGGGIHNKKTKSFVSLNVVLPRNYFDFAIYRGSLFTSESGENLNLMLQAEVNNSSSPAYFQGLGGAVSFDYNLPFGESENGDFHGTFRISGRNLGAYKLHQYENTEIDVNAEFSGFSIEEVRGLFGEEGELPSEIADSLNMTQSTGSMWKFIPGFIQAGKIVEAHRDSKLQSFFGIRMYTNFLYRPLIFVGGDYHPVENFSFGAQGSYGGYGSFRLGMYANYRTKKLNVGIGTEDLLGLLIKNQFGQSAVIRLSMNL